MLTDDGVVGMTLAIVGVGCRIYAVAVAGGGIETAPTHGVVIGTLSAVVLPTALIVSALAISRAHGDSPGGWLGIILSAVGLLSYFMY